jgi:hypothetical protein
MLVIQYPGDTDTKYHCELVAAIGNMNMLPSRRSKHKRKVLVVDSDDEPDSHPVWKSKPPPILFSAFRPPRLNAWNPSLVNHGFTRITAVYQEDGTVDFSVTEAEEEIEIARDWQVGQLANKEAQSKPFWNTRYIGEGYTKTAVYVCSFFGLYMQYSNPSGCSNPY